MTLPFWGALRDGSFESAWKTGRGTTPSVTSAKNVGSARPTTAFEATLSALMIERISDPTERPTVIKSRVE